MSSDILVARTLVRWEDLDIVFAFTPTVGRAAKIYACGDGLTDNTEKEPLMRGARDDALQLSAGGLDPATSKNLRAHMAMAAVMVPHYRE